MKLAFILASALSAAPAAPPQEPPAYTLVPQGQAFQCLSVGGCYVANESGMDALVQEIVEKATALCRKSKAL